MLFIKKWIVLLVQKVKKVNNVNKINKMNKVYKISKKAEWYFPIMESTIFYPKQWFLMK